MGVPLLKPRLAQLGQRLAPMTWRAGLTTGERGYDYRWQQARAAYLQAHPLCVMCAPRLVPATVVDHREPHRGDQRLFWDRTNWQSLCKTCHDRHKQAQEARGWADPDGGTVDPGGGGRRSGGGGA